MDASEHCNSLISDNFRAFVQRGNKRIWESLEINATIELISLTI